MTIFTKVCPKCAEKFETRYERMILCHLCQSDEDAEQSWEEFYEAECRQERSEELDRLDIGYIEKE